MKKVFVLEESFQGKNSYPVFNSIPIFSGNLKACFLLYFYRIWFPVLPFPFPFPFPLPLPLLLPLPFLPPITGKRCSAELSCRPVFPPRIWFPFTLFYCQSLPLLNSGFWTSKFLSICQVMGMKVSYGELCYCISIHFLLKGSWQ